MSDREFQLNWAIQQTLITYLDKEQHDDIEGRRAARKAIAYEKAGIEEVPGLYNGVAFDPSTASPEQIQDWLANLPR